jgi:hypothetical protein
MIESQKIKNEFDNKGYVIVPNIVNQEKIQILRKKILDFFNKNPTQRMIMPSDIINNFSEVFELQVNSKLLRVCKEIFNEFNYINDFQIQKNMCNIDDIGWHYDGGTSFGVKTRSVDDISKEINGEYRIAKIGISLTENDCRFGQMIDIVEGSHNWNNLKRALINKLLVNKWTPRLFKKYLIDNMTGKINPGDCVIFDSGLLHRSQMVKIDDVPEHRNNASHVITSDSKLTIYFEVGNKNSCEWFVKNNLAYANKKEIGTMEEKYHSDYLRFDKSLYPEWYLNELKIFNVDITELQGHKRSIASDIYLS